MAVDLTLTKTIAGSAISDTLTGGSTGLNFGISSRGDPVPTQQTLFIKHNGINEITNLALHVQAYTGVYAGNYSASADLAKLKAHGDLNCGLQVDMRWDGSPRFSAFTQIKTGVGDAFATRVVITDDAMSRNNSGTEVDASAAVDGSVGATGNTTLGDRAHIVLRYLNPAAEAQLGKRQLDLCFSYNFTS